MNQKRTAIIAVFGILVALFAVAAGVGCNNPIFPEQAQISIRYNPLTGFAYKDTKDNNIEAEGEYDPDTKAFKFKTKVISNASDVNAGMVPWMQEFAEQMKQRNEQDRITGQNISLAIQGLNHTVANFGAIVTQLGQITADALNIKTRDFEAGNKAATPMTPASGN